MAGASASSIIFNSKRAHARAAYVHARMKKKGAMQHLVFALHADAAHANLYWGLVLAGRQTCTAARLSLNNEVIRKNFTINAAFEPSM